MTSNPYFTKEDFNLLANHGEKPWYKVDERIKGELRTLSNKLDFLGRSVVKKFLPERQWQYKNLIHNPTGGDEKAKVKPFYWGRIYPDKESKEINLNYAIILLHTELIFKIDIFQNKSSKNSRLFEKYKNQNNLTVEKSISIKEIESYDESRLVNEIVNSFKSWRKDFDNIKDYLLKNIEKTKKEKGNKNSDPETNTSSKVQFHPGVLVKSKSDLLGIKKDAIAIAQLICLKDLKQELAIGLFGHWGSGKTFFMDMIESSFEDLKDEKYYYNNVHCIKFNAWHYSDGNILASLVSNIFAYIVSLFDGKPNMEVLKNGYLESLQLYKKTKEELVEREHFVSKEKEGIEKRIKEIEQQKKEVTPSIKTLKEFAAKTLQDNPEIEEKMRNIANDLKVELPDSPTPKDVESLYNTLNNGYLIFKKFGLLWKKADSKYRTVFLIITLISTCLFLGLCYPPIKAFFSGIIGSLFTNLISFLAPLSAIVSIVMPYVKGATGLLNKINEVKKQFEKDIERTKEIELKNEKELIENRILLERELQQLEIEKREVEKKQTYYEDKLSHYDLNEEIAHFIRDRSASADYKAHLGIVTMVKEDFERLKKLLSKSKEENGTNDNPKIEKIVLFIDDLDRCRDEVVLEVLEIVHLILALDLFAVVVGVDARWVSGALKKRYGHKLDDTKGQASPYDYLEKIFQIPYVLSPMTNSSKEMYIDGLLENISKNDDNPEKPTEKNLDEEQKDNGNRKTKNAETNKNQDSSNDPKTELPNEPEGKNTEIELQVPTLEEKEREFINLLAPLLSNTPRTIRRYINTYMIIKAKEDIRVDENEEFKVVMFLLALVICQNTDPLIQDLFKIIYKNENKTASFEEYISALILSQSPKSPFSHGSLDNNVSQFYNSSAFLQSLLEIVPEEENMENFKLAILGVQKLFNNKKFGGLTKYVQIIQQFSFRSLEV